MKILVELGDVLTPERPAPQQIDTGLVQIASIPRGA